jgi:two-component system sensor histidine kinase UhpB
MNPSIKTDVGGTPKAESSLPDFHKTGVAGSIDLLTAGLRAGGTAIEWHTPHHGMEIDLRAVLLLYRTAEDTLAALAAAGTATRVAVTLAAVYQGIRLTIEDNSGEAHHLDESLRTAVELFGGSTSSGPVSKADDGEWHRMRVTLPLA